MIYLHKIIPIFVLPIMLLIIIILIGLIKNNKKIIYIALFTFYIISTPLFANKFFILLEGNEYIKPIRNIDHCDAIIVLSGMLRINELGGSTYIEWGDPDRFYGGIDLFKEGKAQKLVFTGGKIPWNKSEKNEGEVLKEFAISNGIASEKIFITKDVENTADEAVAVKQTISSNKKIILVTSAYHMYRAKRLFEKQGFDVIPFKVDYKTERNSVITIIDFLPSANNLEMTEKGVREIIGRLFYLIKD